MHCLKSYRYFFGLYVYFLLFGLMRRKGRKMKKLNMKARGFFPKLQEEKGDIPGYASNECLDMNLRVNLYLKF